MSRPSTATSNQKHPPEADRYLLTKQQQKLSQLNPRNLSVTHLLIPTREGKHHTQTFYFQKEKLYLELPSGEGRGCVTPEHSLLNPKQLLKADRYNLTKQQQNNLCPHCTLHRTPPLSPLRKWKSSITENSKTSSEKVSHTAVYTTKKSFVPDSLL